MPNTPIEISASPFRRWMFIALSVGALAAVVVLLSDTEDTVDVSRKTAAPAAPVVSVLPVTAQDARARISVFAELRPRWNAEIRAPVSGRIRTVHKAALAGTRVTAGTPLFEVERTSYETAVTAAEMAVEEAELARLHAQNNVTVARRQFARDGTKPPNDLALRLPDLRIAEKSLASAQAQLAAAHEQLADTVIKAPFSGFVTARLASLGQTVSGGEALVTLSDDTHFEMTVELSRSDWALLDHPIADGTAQLFHRNGRPLGTAKIRQGGGFLDPQTRQMRIFLEVSDPAKGVLAGDFLRVVFDGQRIANTLTLPETALTRAGYIWLVSEEDVLLRHSPELLFRGDGTITIAKPTNVAPPWRVVRTPLGSFLPGQRVTPQKVER
ncbi:efflux RND transporter periplasmic adaptor subunit [Phycobacter azelaicus]|uniref:efflux RND transporter periplasmic adaptor subunit n=1 Tax=Phycobacter azelaicus TaxID=2668075 RepID=UPI0018678165|nr:efflux RND transporter periplasmic adaptor subunit [Phycobacter azelaicus]MBE1296782.1 efflux RND transporter periplasmic adaptor subunit [Paracoccaceae bacterium]